MHDLKTERFFEPTLVNGRMAVTDGPIKSFPLRGIKDRPPYLHDDRLLTLEDTVEFFNLVLGLELDEQQKSDLVAFMYASGGYVDIARLKAALSSTRTWTRAPPRAALHPRLGLLEVSGLGRHTRLESSDSRMAMAC